MALGTRPSYPATGKLTTSQNGSRTVPVLVVLAAMVVLVAACTASASPAPPQSAASDRGHLILETRVFERGEAPSIPAYEDFEVCGGVPSPARLYGLDLEDGSAAWEVGLPWSRFGDPWIDEHGAVYVVGSGWDEPASVMTIDLDGQPRWQASLNANPHGHNVAATRDTIFVTAASEEGDDETDVLLAVDRGSGKLRWFQPLNGPAVRFGGMVLWDDLVIVADYSGHVVAFGQELGGRAWSRDLGGSPDEFLLVDDGTVYAVGRPKLFAIDAQTGEVLWETSHPEPGARVVSTRSVVGSVVVAIAENATTSDEHNQFLVVGFATDTGAMVWVVPSSDSVVLGDGMLLTGDGSREGAGKRRIRAWSVAEGRRLWRSPGRHVLRRSIVDAAAAVLVSHEGQDGGRAIVTSVLAATGQSSWTVSLDGRATSPPLATDARVVVATRDRNEQGGTLTGLSREDGQPLWETDLSDLVEVTPTILGGTIVVIAAHQPSVCI